LVPHLLAFCPTGNARALLIHNRATLSCGRFRPARMIV
jgi:hypothetical protein